MLSLQRRQVLTLAALGLPALSARAAPIRLVCVGGALTELVFELGAEKLLVGVDTTSIHPAAARSLPKVGYARTLSAEGLLSLAPNLIVATEDAGPPAVLRQLEAARVPLHTLPAEHRFEGLISRTLKLGELIERQPQARALADKLNHQWLTSQQQVAQLQSSQLRQGRTAPRVLFILSHGMSQVRISGSDTAADAMMVYAGGVNALQGQNGFSGYKPLTPEAVIAAAPDVIMSTDQGLEAAGGIDGLLKLPGLAQTPAGQKKRVVAFDAMELLGFGPRMPLATAKLAQALHAKA